MGPRLKGGESRSGRAMIPLLLALFFLPFGMSSSLSWASECAGLSPDSYVPNELLVRFSPESSEAEMRSIEREYSLSRLAGFPHLKTYQYRTPTDSAIEVLCEELRKEPFIKDAELNFISPLNELPRDEFLDRQWSIKDSGQLVNGKRGPGGMDINLEEALLGYRSTSSVVVAVIDSGIALDHPDLNPNLWGNPIEIQGQEGVDDDQNGYVDDFFGWDFVDGNGLPFDEHGHGTHVASIIAAESGNSLGIVGVAQDVRLMTLRVADDFGDFGQPILTTARTLAATTYAVLNGAKVINASYSASFSQIMQAQIQWIDQNGVLLVAAAGNGGPDQRGDSNDLSPVFPASYGSENIISVAALDREGSLARFSNFGSQTVDLAAPGTDIFGASITRSGYFLETFESGAPGWANGIIVGNASTDQWALWGDEFGNTWLTDSLDSNFIQKPYSSNANTFALSPQIDLQAVSGPRLKYSLMSELEPLFDFLVVEGSIDGLNWDLLDFRTGFTVPGFFSEIELDISRYEGSIAQFRFRIVTDATENFGGVAIDNVAVTRTDTFRYDGRQWAYKEGTSFAAPLVSGAAALIFAEAPNLSHRDVRSLLIQNARPLNNLRGKVASGGMLDVARARRAALTLSEQIASAQTGEQGSSQGSGDSGGTSPQVSAGPDFDQDGIPDDLDSDDDGDGVPDNLDPVPLNGSRSTAGLKPDQVLRLDLSNRQFFSPTLGSVAIDSRASAISINVTSVFPEQDGYISVWPCTQELPDTSSLNFERFRIHSNHIVSSLNAAGEICFFSSQDSGLVVDITGFFSGGSFVGFQPKRVLDTRLQLGSGAANPPSITEVDLGDFTFTSLSSGRSERLGNYQGVFLNGVVTEAEAPGYLTVWSCDDPRPATSNINYAAGQTIANGLLVALGPSKSVCLFNSTSANFLLDFAGAFAAGYTPVTPSRLVDSRRSLGVSGKLFAGQELPMVVRGRSIQRGRQAIPLPESANAVALNLTTVNSELDGFITAWPCGEPRPSTSSLNFERERTIANNALVAIGGTGEVCFYTSAATDLLVDIVGYSEPSVDGQMIPISPERIIDTRTNTGPTPSARQ